jgi:adenylate kinase family enzyme
MTLQRIHITGGPGSGKTTAGRGIASKLNLPFHELDQILIGMNWDMARAVDENTAGAIADQDAWLTEGAYFGWAQPLLDRAALVVLLDPPWRVASYRIITRYFKAELSRNNQHHGLRRLKDFWAWSRRYYRDTNRHTLNDEGVPRTRARALEELSPYREKLRICRSKRDVDRLLAELAHGSPIDRASAGPRGRTSNI